MSKSFEQLGCSKINIGLAITGKREDGYHDIDSIFQSIRLSDSIYFAKHHSVVFSGGAPELPEYMQKLVTYGEENLALKALRAIQAYTGCKAGAAIHLLKRVPIEADDTVKIKKVKLYTKKPSLSLRKSLKLINSPT